MYCPECGTKIEDDARFCPECGTRMEQATHNVDDVQECAAEDSKDNDIVISCIILTNINLLAKSLHADANDIRTLLQQFIDIKKQAGIRYLLADASNYTYCKRGFLGARKKVSLDANSSIWDYTDILMDIHTHEKSGKRIVSEYVFIVGGNDVIPMPCTKNYVAHNKDNKTVDSDILYSFPYGKEMLANLENLEIFKYDQLFHVGRLPFGKDSTLDDLCSYLQRDIENTYGIPFTEAYAQCDPNWKNVSTRVAAESSLIEYLRNFDGKIIEECYYNRLILSPHVDIRNLDQIFHTSASLYYYNMHGSNALETPFYLGESIDKNICVPGIAPQHMGSIQTPNAVFSEACYGARFIGLDKEKSMMLSSIHSNTLNFVGSSRVSWGATDNGASSPNNVGVSNADIMAAVYIKALLEGYNMGQALLIARNAVFNSRQPGDPHAALTIVEFNLFGDPTLYIVASEELLNKAKQEKQINTKPTDKKPLADKNDAVSYTREDIKNEEEEGPTSLLQQVRNAVNSNIAQMHEIIGKELYATYGIEPRPADSIFKIKYADGRETYHFNYKTSDKNSDIEQYCSVTASPDGKIENVLHSK